MSYQISRFTEAQKNSYETALYEIKNGRKTSHWIWYIFPQLKGLGHSRMCDYYGIVDLNEAQAYLADPLLREHLEEICYALLELDADDISAVMGYPDDKKLNSSMTLFAAVPGASPVYRAVLDRYYCGKQDHRTLSMLGL